jgi:hypothetical protein
VLERLGLIDAHASSADCQLAIGAIARALSRDAYAIEGALALFAALGPCRPQPACSSCTLSGRCPSASA